MRETASDPTPDVLRADLRRVAARETDDPPTRADYDAHGEWSPATVAKHLGGDGHSWADALDDAGVGATYGR